MFIIVMLVALIGIIAMFIQAIPTILSIAVVGIIMVVCGYRLIVLLYENFGGAVTLGIIGVLIVVLTVAFFTALNADLMADVYIVTADSNYESSNNRALFVSEYKSIPAGSTIAWVYHDDRYGYQKGKWYIHANGSADYREITDFHSKGFDWNVSHLKTITYKEFKKGKWWVK